MLKFEKKLKSVFLITKYNTNNNKTLILKSILTTFTKINGFCLNQMLLF